MTDKVQITFFANKQFREMLKADAYAHGKNVSEYLRYLAEMEHIRNDK